MKQVFQNLGTGETTLDEVPCPRLQAGRVLIRTSTTLVSAGTERMLVEFGKANLINKARQQPDKVRQVLDKIGTDGLLPTLEAVRSKLAHAIPLGYCNVGTVVEVGAGVSGVAAGDRVASNGSHAEMVSVPANLCARIPQGVADEAAAFTVLGAIALQGVRLAQPTLGEAVVVTGLGLIGLLAVQLLRAQGCRVLGIDLDPRKLALAKSFGAEVVDLAAGEDPLARAQAFSRGRGVDAVIVAAATQSSEPIHQAAQICRKRGRIVLVGVTGLELARGDFYEKELTFQVSCSYGPGRYDPRYEEGGQDYPIGFVRWTEQRNFEAVLDMMQAGQLQVENLITHRFPFAEAVKAYAALAVEKPLGMLLQFPAPESRSTELLRAGTIRLSRGDASPARGGGAADGPAIAFIGAGNYASRILIPAFARAGARLVAIAANTGANAAQTARKFGIPDVSTDVDAQIRRADVDTVVIATRHDSHARLVVAALQAGKHVFVEKPLATSLDELLKVERAYRDLGGGAPRLMVGFNRRFAPHSVRMKALLAAMAEPKSILITVNAGAIPGDHWTQDDTAGGGRIIGEACHFIDLARFLAGAPIAAVAAVGLGKEPGVARADDKATITLRFSDGSFAAIHYLANGHRSFPKERIEVFCGGRVMQLDNFRVLRGFGWPGLGTMRLWRQDKGQALCASATVLALRDGKSAPIPADDLFEVSAATIEAASLLRT